jgi:hypothetical protein
MLNLDPTTMWLDETVVSGWRLRLTRAEQVRRSELRDSLGVAETHAGVIDRASGSPFPLREALQALDAWRLAVSFATGGHVGVWRHTPIYAGADDGWRSFSLPTVSPWFDRHRIIDAHDRSGLTELLALVMMRRADLPDAAAIDELAMNYALETNRNSPIEMRIAAAGAGLELLAWDQLVEDEDGASNSRAERKRSFRERGAAANFELLLSHARIDTSLPPELATYEFDDEHEASGPRAVAALRNRVMHPRRRAGELSVSADLWTAGWQVAAQYLDLLILHRLGYQGRYSDRQRSEWVGVTFEVPWSNAAAQSGGDS